MHDETTTSTHTRYRVRGAGPDDLPALSALYEDNFGRALALGDVVDAMTEWAIAEASDGSILGCYAVTFVRQPGRWNGYTTGLVVADRARGQGIAGALVSAVYAAADARAERYETALLVFATVRADRPASAAAHVHAGAFRRSIAASGAPGWDVYCYWAEPPEGET